MQTLLPLSLLDPHHDTADLDHGLPGWATSCALSVSFKVLLPEGRGQSAQDGSIAPFTSPSRALPSPLGCTRGFLLFLQCLNLVCREEPAAFAAWS